MGFARWPAGGIEQSAGASSASAARRHGDRAYLRVRGPVRVRVLARGVARRRSRSAEGVSVSVTFRLALLAPGACALSANLPWRPGCQLSLCSPSCLLSPRRRARVRSTTSPYATSYACYDESALSRETESVFAVCSPFFASSPLCPEPYPLYYLLHGADHSRSLVIY